MPDVRLQVVVWEEVDQAAAELAGVPEADGVVSAARKHMSFMPLELFDNLDYETHTPEEWVALGAHSQVRAHVIA
jgi:hypothetical protein